MKKKQKITSIDSVVSKNIRKFREESGLTIEKLANKSQISSNYISHVLSSKKRASYEVLERIAAAMQISVWDLFKDETPLKEGFTDLDQRIFRQIKRIKHKEKINTEKISDLLKIIIRLINS